MKYFFFVLVLVLFQPMHSQTNGSPIFDSTGFLNQDNLTNETIQIPLYQVTLNDISVPIFLTYDNSGIKVNDIPSSVGLKWELLAGAKIMRSIRHIPDEFKGLSGFLSSTSTDTIYGWLSDNYIVANFDGDYFNDDLPTPDVTLGHNVTSYHDASPDLYSFSASNGDFLEFSFKKEFDFPTLQTSDFDISLFELTNKNKYLLDYDLSALSDPTCTSCDDFILTNKQGVSYHLSKGPKNEIPYIYGEMGGPSSDYNFYSDKNFYVSKITSQKFDDEIAFSYISNPQSRYTILANVSNKSVDDYWEGILVEESNSNEVSEILTPKERIEFLYSNFTYDTNSGDIFDDDPVTFSTTVKLLNEILIYDHNDALVLGYTFEYSSFQGGNGKPFLSKIFKVNKDNTNKKLFREFTYFDPDFLGGSLTAAQDVLGYSNDAYSNANFDPNGYRNLTPIDYQYSPTGLAPASNRKPSLDILKAGMLKTITTNFGGSTEYSYVMNSSGKYYFGGLLVSSISQLDSNGGKLSQVDYAYDIPNGFYIPILTNIGDPDEHDWKNLFQKKIENMGSGVSYYNISNRAFEKLDTDAPLIIPGNANRYQKHGSFFKEITETPISVNPLLPLSSIGSIKRHYEPSYAYSGRNKILNKIEKKDALGRNVETVDYTYEMIIHNTIDVSEFSNNHDNYSSGCSGGTGDPRLVEDPLYGPICIKGHRYSIIDSEMLSLDYIKKEETKIIENPDFNTSNSVLTTFEYYGEGTANVDYSKTKKISKYKANSSTNVLSFTENLFLSELSNIPTGYDNLLGYSDPIIQSAQWEINGFNTYLKKANIFEFLFNGKTHKRYSKLTSSTGGIFEYSSYTDPTFDLTGNLLNPGELLESYKYYSNGKLCAKLYSRAPLNEFYYYSSDYDENYLTATLMYSGETGNCDGLSNLFESLSFEGDLSASIIASDNAFSGNNVYQGSSLSLGSFLLPTIVSYWAFIDNKWQFRSQEFPSGLVTITFDSSALFIDEVNVRPKNSTINTYTIHPLVGTLSVCDNNGNTVKYHFDEYQREVYTTNRDNKVLTQTEYNTINNN